MLNSAHDVTSVYKCYSAHAGYPLKLNVYHHPPRNHLQYQTEMASQPFQKRAIVSSFIFQHSDNEQQKPLVALFRRSGQVRTYR